MDEILPTAEQLTKKKPGSFRAFFLLIEINFNSHIPHADVLDTPRIPEDVLHNFG
jgi:hypothetical protein